MFLPKKNTFLRNFDFHLPPEGLMFAQLVNQLTNGAFRQREHAQPWRGLDYRLSLLSELILGTENLADVTARLPTHLYAASSRGPDSFRGARLPASSVHLRRHGRGRRARGGRDPGGGPPPWHTFPATTFSSSPIGRAQSERGRREDVGRRRGLQRETGARLDRGLVHGPRRQGNAPVRGRRRLQAIANALSFLMARRTAQRPEPEEGQP